MEPTHSRQNAATEVFSVVVEAAVTAVEQVVSAVSLSNLARDDQEYQLTLAQEKTELLKGENDLLEQQAKLQEEKNKQTTAIVLGGIAAVVVLGGFIFLTSESSPKRKKKKELP